MLHLIQRLWSRLEGETVRLLLLALVLLLIWGTIAPVGTLVWWLGEGAKSLGLKQNLPVSLPASDRATEAATEIDCYIVFLPGVGDFSTNQLTDGEEWFLTHLVERHPRCVAVRDVFPYSVANQDLAGKRLFAPIWKVIEKGNGWLKDADVFIKIRNLWRFAISADERYGPVYNQGIASAIVERMNAAHPIPDYVLHPSAQTRDRPLNLILIGTSGGAQVALGAGSYLHSWLQARLTVVSVGGVFDGEAGFDQAAHVYHLHGQRDPIEDLSRVFPAHWGWTVGSPFNQAQRQGRYTILGSGPHAHDGDEGYFGTAIVPPDQATPNRTTYVALTFQAVDRLPIWSLQKAAKAK